MSVITASDSIDVPIPDDLTIPQFFLDHDHPSRSHAVTDDFVAFIDGATGRKVTWKESRERCHAIANGLYLHWAIEDNEAICIFAPNHVDYIPIAWGIHRLGGIVASSNPTYTVEELVHQLNITKSSAVIVHPSYLMTVTIACQQVGIPLHRIALFSPAPKGLPFVTIDDLVAQGSQRPQSYTERRLAPGEGKKRLAFLNLSSGTTGPPKAVSIPHYALIANVIQITVSDVVKPGVPPENKKMIDGSIVTGVLPFFHIYGLVSNVHSTLFTGATIVVMAKFVLEDFLNDIMQYRITHLLVVPPIIVLLCKHPLAKKYDLSHVYFLNSGGAPLSPELIAPLSKVLPNAIIAQGYGMTETATAVTQTPMTDRILKGGSVGRLLPGVKMRVVKEDGTTAKPGEPGEMFVYSPSNAIAYYGNEKATKETFIDGWVRTGDEIIYEESGDIYVIDRLKDLIKVRGFQVAPAELEGHLLDHPDVADACVVPVPDDFNGELPFAFIVLRPHAATLATDPKAAAKLKKAIASHVSDAKIKYKWLNGGIEFIDVVPKNASGKLLRRMLKDRAKAARKVGLANAGPQVKL